ncbi:MAG TPA: GNAT family N-acetyltransferase [Afipia sp.]
MLAEPDHRFVLSNLGRYTDVLRLKSGGLLTVRFLETKDADALLSYFRSLSRQSRYNRLMGAASELPPSELDKALYIGEGSRFAVVAEMNIDGVETIVGESRYSYDAETRNTEFGLSIEDAWQGQGIGTAMLSNLECRAAALGALRLFGETFRNNEQMIGLARKRGYEFAASPNDWRQVRFERRLYRATEIPCESWKQAATAGWRPNEALLDAR